MGRCALVLICLLLSPWTAAAEETLDRRIAVTVDDLPWQRIGDLPEPRLQARHAQLIATMRRAGVPATGFVNEAKLEVDGRLDPGRVRMLHDWLEAGYGLGNHTYGHVDLHEVGAEAFQEDILRGERVLGPLLAGLGEAPVWFRHPYLHTGRSEEEARLVAGFLSAHGYRIAPVTVGTGEWIWAAAYGNVLDGRSDVADALERMELLQRLHGGYVSYMLHMLDHAERQSQALLGYALPQVLLLHANELNAVAYADLVDGMRRRGYRFVTLDEAMEDPAYARPDAYHGLFGPGWLHRWAMTEDVPRSFHAGEPRVPDWVLELAGVETE